jgi:hypothetical protein
LSEPDCALWPAEVRHQAVGSGRRQYQLQGGAIASANVKAWVSVL